MKKILMIACSAAVMSAPDSPPQLDPGQLHAPLWSKWSDAEKCCRGLKQNPNTPRAFSSRFVRRTRPSRAASVYERCCRSVRPGGRGRRSYTLEARARKRLAKAGHGSLDAE